MGEKARLYRRKLVKQLYFDPALSCAALSVGIEKSLPLTTKILNELVREGYIEERGLAPSTGGRRPLMFSLKSDVLYTVSVAMDQYVTRIVLMDMHNRFVGEVKKVELALPKNEKALSMLTGCIEEAINESGISKQRIAGIGIGMPGFVDATKGINYSFLESSGRSICDFIGEKIKLPVWIDNDSSLIALAELRFGAARGRSNSMVVNMGWGVGLGLVLNGELYRGNNGFAGEFSHIPLFLNGKLCSCGKTGCLETETSLLVAIRKAQQGVEAGRVTALSNLTKDHLEEASDEILAAARKGDRFAVELFSEIGYNIGRGVAILIHVLNPEVIILSGRGSAAGKIWQPPIQQAVNEHCIPLLAANTTIEISTMGYHAELIGAATLVMENFDARMPEMTMWKGAGGLLAS